MRALLCFYVIACGCLSLVRLEGHPHDLTTTQIDWIPETHTLEVAMQLSAENLEEVFIKQIGHEILIDGKNAQGEKLLKSYLEKHVVFFGSKGNGLPWKWVGYEVEDNTVWAYLEASLGDEAIGQCSMANTILLEEHEDQLNLVNFRREKKRRTLQFHRKKTKLRLPDW